MISMHIMKSIMRRTAGIIRTVTRITAAGTAGAEGETDDPEILRLRKTAAENAYAVPDVRRGAVMVRAGMNSGIRSTETTQRTARTTRYPGWTGII